MKKLLQILLITSGLSITSLYAYDYGRCCEKFCDPMGTGFLVGAYGTFHSFYFHAKDEVVDPARSEVHINRFEYDLIQRAPGGGGYVG